jgi:ABC-type oligopeptide transport system ATPase subunit
MGTSDRTSIVGDEEETRLEHIEDKLTEEAIKDEIKEVEETVQEEIEEVKEEVKDALEEIKEHELSDSELDRIADRVVAKMTPPVVIIEEAVDHEPEHDEEPDDSSWLHGKIF